MLYNAIPGYTLLGYGEAIFPPGGRPPGPCATDPQTGKTSCPVYDPTMYYIGWGLVVSAVVGIMYKTLTMKAHVPMRANRSRKRKGKSK